MGKGRKGDNSKRKGGQQDGNEYMGGRDEDLSDEEIHSQGTNVDSLAATTKSTDLSEEFPYQVDNLTDNSGPRRIKALLDILSSLKAGVDLSVYVLSFRDDIVAGIVWILRRHQMESECVLAMQLACIFALIVGADEDSYFLSLQDALMFSVTRSSNQEIRKWAITSLAFISFICSSDINVPVWRFCGDVLCQTSEAEKPTPYVQAAAAEAWVLLSSTLSPAAVIHESKERIFPVIVQLMREANTDVKVSAGESLAYLWEAAVEAGDERFSSGEAEDVGATLCDDEELVAAAIQLVEDISKEHSKRVSKKDRKEQRSAYRLLGDWIIRGEVPHDTIRMGGATVEVKSFARLRLFEVLRAVLGDAFQTALRAFPVLRSVLGVDHFSMDFMDGGGDDRRVEKGSSESKKRTNMRNQERRFRDVMKAY